jgi:nitroreductase
MAFWKTKLNDLMLLLRLAKNFWYDYRRFAKASFMVGPRKRENRRALIHILYHSIEHGLSLSEPQAGFGREKIKRLLQETKAYINDFGIDMSAAAALRTVEAWARYSKKNGDDILSVEQALKEIEESSSFRELVVSGGTEQVSLSELRKVSSIDFTSFMQSRHSVRQFSDQLVTKEEIELATIIAQQAPSVCNRQTCRVYAFTDEKDKARVLSFQSGNRGFGLEIGAVLIVTSNMEHLNLVGERNQHWVDGGLFAMTLSLAFHGAQMGACMLNWSVTRDVDKSMRACVGIPENEAVITMMGVGHLKDVFEVPCSQRKPVDIVLSLNPALN